MNTSTIQLQAAREALNAGLYSTAEAKARQAILAGATGEAHDLLARARARATGF